MGCGYRVGNGKIVSQNKHRCVFYSKPILFVVATRCRGNRKSCSFSDTYKAEARFRVKKIVRFAEARFRIKKKVGFAEARLLVCRVLVLTHNFEVWRPVIARLLVFWNCGLRFQSRQW